MRFIVDECTGPWISKWLIESGHDVFCIFTQARGLDDVNILNKACNESYVIITSDKDFGELVYKDKLPHKGIVLLRLTDGSVKNRIKVISTLISNYSENIINHFTVVTDNGLRIVL